VKRNVVVTPSTYGTDNRCTLAAIAQFGADARATMLARPGLYLKGVGKSFLLYGRPASDYMLIGDNRAHMHAYETAYNALLGTWPVAEGRPVRDLDAMERFGGFLARTAWGLVVAFPLLIAFGWRALRRASDPNQRALLAFLLFNIAWVTATSNLVEIGDNNRYRYDIDGCYLALFGLWLQGLLARGERAPAGYNS